MYVHWSSWEISASARWNVANIFTGWVDVDLSEKGLGEAKGAGELLKAQKRVLGAFGYLGLCMALHFFWREREVWSKKLFTFFGDWTKMMKHACKFDVERGSSDVLHYTRLIQMCRSSGSIFGLPVPYLVLQHAVTSLNHKMARLEGCEPRQYHVGLNTNIVTLNWLLRYIIPLKPYIYNICIYVLIFIGYVHYCW